MNKYLSPFDQPLLLDYFGQLHGSALYTSIRALSVGGARLDTQYSAGYSSGLPILAPYANNNLNQLLAAELARGTHRLYGHVSRTASRACHYSRRI